MRINILKSKVISTYLIFIFFLGCASIKNERQFVAKESIGKNENYNFTEFYNISFATKLKENIFKLDEPKKINLTITNYGTKDLYVPSWFIYEHNNQSELIVKLYKKKNLEYTPYKQESKIVETTVISTTDKREILSSKKGNVLCFDNIQIDKLLKIVDLGKYKADIIVDLSNFGYFKKLETSFFFEVIE